MDFLCTRSFLAQRNDWIRRTAQIEVEILFQALAFAKPEKDWNG